MKRKIILLYLLIFTGYLGYAQNSNEDPGWNVSTENSTGAHYRGVAVAYDNGTDKLVYQFGGWSNTGSKLNEISVYDVNADSYSVLADTIPIAAIRAACGTIVGDDIYILPGVDENGDYIKNKFLKYNITSGIFTELAPCPDTTKYGTMNYSVASNKIYVTGGYGKSIISGNNDVFDAYDIATDTWVAGNTPVVTGTGGTAISIADDKMILIGGSSRVNQLGDIAADGTVTWTTKAAYPDTLGYRPFVGYVGGKRLMVSEKEGTYIYNYETDTWAIGGDEKPTLGFGGKTANFALGNRFQTVFVGGKDVNSVEISHAETFVSEEYVGSVTNEEPGWNISAMTSTGAHYRGAAIGYENGADKLVYQFGGWSNTSSKLNEISVYNVNTDTYSILADTLPVLGSRGACATLIGDDIYFAQGADESGANTSNFFKYNIPTSTFTQLAPSPDVTKYGTMNYLAVTNKIYLTAGAGTSNKFDAYDIATDTWESGSTPMSISHGASSVTIGDNKIAIIGGFSYVNVLAEVAADGTVTWITNAAYPDTLGGRPSVGYIGGDNIMVSDNEGGTYIYNLATDTWEEFADPKPTLGFGGRTATFALGNRFQTVFVGGKDVNGDHIANAETFVSDEYGITYCEASSSDSTYEYIENVNFGTIDNTSIESNYSDFTHLSTTINSSEAVDLTVTLGGSYSSDQVFVWIDWNSDGDFDDTNEEVFVSATGAGPHTTSILAPADATLGETRMRIRMEDSGAGSNGTPCGESSYGEVEDYTVIIEEGTATYYDATFSIFDMDSNPINGAEVIIDNDTLYTDVNGNAVFSLIDGTYNYTVNKEGYENKTGEITINGANIEVDVIMSLELFEVEFSVLFNGNPIEGAEVIVIDTDTMNTDANGIATFDLANGTYSYSILKDGFDIEEGDFTVNESNIQIDIDLNETTYEIEFTVVEGVNAIEGANVTIDSETVTTNANGIAIFNLVNGDYSYTVTKNGFEQEEGNFTVNGENIEIEVSIFQSEYLVTFNVSDGDGNPVENANVAIDDSNIITDVNGIASIELVNGVYEYIVTADSFGEAQGDITVEGETIEENVALPESIFEISSIESIVYPNPSNGYFNFELEGEWKLIITDISGEKIFSTSFTNKLSVDLSEKASGTYLIKLVSNNNIISRKIMIH